MLGHFLFYTIPMSMISAQRTTSSFESPGTYQYTLSSFVSAITNTGVKFREFKESRDNYIVRFCFVFENMFIFFTNLVCKLI